jgi:MFS family permease
MRANYPAKWRSSLLARVLAMSEAMMAVAGLAFGFVLELDPMVYRLLFPLAGACGLLGAYQVGRIQLQGRKTAKAANAQPPDFSLPRIHSVLRHDHRFLRYEIAFFLFGFANIMTLPIIPFFLEEDLGIRYADAGLILVTLPMILDIFMLPLWGRTLDRQNPLLMRAIFNVIFALGILTYWASTSLLVFATGRLIVAFVQGGSVLVWVLGVNYFARHDEVPVYMGLHQTLTGIRGVIAPFVGTGLAALFASNRAAFLAAFILMMSGTLVMINEVVSELRRTGGRLPSYAQAERQIDTRYTA